jgi:hypothetical protein
MNNDQLILDQIVEETREQHAPKLDKAEFFEAFVVEQVLKEFDLTADEIESGLAGGTRDGGIDGLYTFVNGELVQEDFNQTGLKKSVLIEVVVIQTKTSNGFDEGTIDKLMASTGHLFALANNLDEFKNRYNEAVRSSAEIFRKLYRSTASRFPTVRFRYIYASYGDSASVHPNVTTKANDLRAVIKGLFPSSEFEFSFIGATALLDLARQQPPSSFQIQVSEFLTGNSGYIALVKLKDFVKFICDPAGGLRKALFEANVRDYQGSNQVNDDMQQSLRTPGPEDFWWLNNGVTIVATKATQAGKQISLEDPQIVNGQQSSTEIFSYFQALNPVNEDRSVMVRVVVVSDSQSRDRIIKATNSQTSMPTASLRATEKIHRDIETFLAPHSLYYDRRKNSQKQAGRSVEQIISIGAMAQSMMSIVLQRPDDARARPSSLIKDEKDYLAIFNAHHPIKIFLIAAKLTKVAHSHLRTRAELAPRDRTNLLFYLVMIASVALTQSAAPKLDQLVLINPDQINNELMKECLDILQPVYEKLGANDKISKGAELLVALRQDIAKRYPHSLEA